MKRLVCCVLIVFSFQLFAQEEITPAFKLQMTLRAIDALYVDSVDDNALVEEALKAMVKKLDPHTSYMSSDELKELNEPLQGGFDGVGISFNMMNDTLFVVEVITGGPSEKVGILAGDRFLTVNGEAIAGVKMSTREVMKRLKGPKGTTVNIGVKRRNVKEIIEFSVVRDKIPMYSVDASFMLDKNTGYIKISRFGATTMDEYREAFSELTRQGMKQLIIDLQSNGGGYMGTAVELTDEFLDKGKCIVYTQGVHNERSQLDASEKGAFERGNLIVLIDEYSASSSEIFTGAIQDWDRGLVIGRRSFGKGLVQRVLQYGDGSALKLTIARYYTPSGRCIQKPYEDGVEAYSQDVIERYNRGEMQSADSIHFPDSLRYTTLQKQRVVYGGGGIMPDVFVPFDTTRYTSLHKKLINRGVLNRYTLQYTDDHRQTLKETYPNSDAFIRNFEVSQEMIDQLLAMAQADQVKISDEEKASETSLMKTQIKAYIARDLYKTADYYKVMSPENESLQEALRILGDKKLKKQYGLI